MQWPISLWGSYTGTNGWFMIASNGLYNGFQTTNPISLSICTNGWPGDPNILGGGHLVNPGMCNLFTVDHWELLGRQNFGFSEGYSFSSPVNPNDPATKSYVDGQFFNAFDANWSFSTDTNGVNHLSYMYQNLTPFDIASDFNWLPILSNKPTGFQCVATNWTGSVNVYTWIPTNEVIYAAQTNLIAGWSLQSSTNLGYKWGFSLYTNYTATTNAGVVGFQVPIIAEPQRFFRLATPPTNSMTVSMPATFKGAVNFSGAVNGSEPQFLNFLSTNIPSGYGSPNAISNWYGLGTNLTVNGYITNTTFTLATNGSQVAATYTTTISVNVMTMATNGFYLYGASWTPANGLYVWDGPYGSYGAFTNVNGLTIIPTAIYPIIYAISGGHNCLSMSLGFSLQLGRRRLCRTPCWTSNLQCHAHAHQCDHAHCDHSGRAAQFERPASTDGKWHCKFEWIHAEWIAAPECVSVRRVRWLMGHQLQRFGHQLSGRLRQHLDRILHQFKQRHFADPCRLFRHLD